MVDGNLITGQNPGSSEAVGQAVANFKWLWIPITLINLILFNNIEY